MQSILCFKQKLIDAGISFRVKYVMLNPSGIKYSTLIHHLSPFKPARDLPKKATFLFKKKNLFCEAVTEIVQTTIGDLISLGQHCRI